MKKQVGSFRYALKGILNCIINEGHFRFDLVMAAYVIFFGLRFYHLSKIEWLITILTIAIVLLCEAFNTAIEGICDRMTTEYDRKIKYIKDTSAGAVLISAVMAVAVGFIIFFDLNVLKDIYLYFTSHILSLIILICSAVLAIAFMAISPKKKEKTYEQE